MSYFSSRKTEHAGRATSPQPPKINFARDRPDCGQQAEYSTRVIPHFLFVRTKNEWNLYQQPPVCDANPRPTARWHDVFFHTLPFVRTKGLRFLTLRRCARPLSEIASAAGMADACEYCDSQSRAVRRRPTRRTATRRWLVHVLRRRRTAYSRLRPENFPVTAPAALWVTESYEQQTASS